MWEVDWVGVVLVFFPFGFGVFGKSNSILSGFVNGVWSLVCLSFGEKEESISISSDISFRVLVVLGCCRVLVLVVSVRGVKERESRFWSCCCFWKVKVRSFLVEEKSWVIREVELKLVEKEELVVLFKRQT